MSGDKSSQPADVWLPSVNRVDSGEHNGGNTTLRRADQTGGDATSRTEMSPEPGESGSDMSKQQIPVGTELSKAGDIKPESFKVEERDRQTTEAEMGHPQPIQHQRRRSDSGGQEGSRRTGRLSGGNGKGGRDPSQGPPDEAFEWPPPGLREFCQRMDIILPKSDPKNQTSIGNAEFKAMKGGDWERICQSVRLHRFLSWAYTGLAIIMVILQSGLGITTAALVGVQGGRAKNAVIALGAINGFIGAMSGALQYWGQPTRENHYYQSLAVVKGDVEWLIGEFKNPKPTKNPWSEGNTVMAQYNQARTDAESNKPTVWLQNTKPIPTGRV